MAQVNKLHTGVHHITELSNAISLLISDRQLCDSSITCELFFRYIDAVNHHLKHTESGMFAKLLVDSDEREGKILDHFMDGAHEIKQIFNAYTKKWCKNNELRIRDYAEFVKDSSEMFELVLRRLQDETENLYPIVNDKSEVYPQAIAV
jgi:pyruvate-formate lyase-activating enzyme